MWRAMVMEAALLSSVSGVAGPNSLAWRKEKSNNLQVFSGYRNARVATGYSTRCTLRSRWHLRSTVDGELQGVGVQEEEADGLVEELLLMVKDTDRGAALKQEEKQLVSQLVNKLASMDIPPEPLQSPLLFGEWDVEYCSNPTAPGGYYRSVIGRLVLRTEEMVQTVNAPDMVGNSVAFSLFGLVKGRVSLKGKLVPLDKKWIEITFEPPFLKLGPLELRYGKSSTVKIGILYVDERVRLGRGSRGSLFVFKRRLRV